MIGLSSILGIIPSLFSFMSSNKLDVESVKTRNLVWASFCLVIIVAGCSVASFGDETVNFVACVKEVCSIPLLKELLHAK